MKKDLLIIHDSMNGGGAERVLVTILNNLDRARFNITLLLVYREGPFIKDIPADVEVLSLFDTRRGFFHRVWTHFYRLRNSVRSRLAAHRLGGRRFDTIVSFMEGPPAQLHSQLLGRAARNVSWIHIDLCKGRWEDFWFNCNDERTFYRKVDAIAFVSEGARTAFASMFDTNVPTSVIYNPIDAEAICRGGGNARKTLDEPFTIINVGRLVGQKRQDILIRAVAILFRRGLDFRLNILGTGPLEEPLKKLARDLGVADRVNFAGFISNPYEWIKKSDVFCLTSDAEGYPTVVAESLCLGTPVVATRITGTEEMLSHGGGIFTSHAPEDIADKLEAVMRDADLLKSLKEQTSQGAAQFSVHTVIDRISDFVSPV